MRYCKKIGWIKLDPNKDLATVTQADIIENPKHLKFTEVSLLNLSDAYAEKDFSIQLSNLHC